MAYFYWVAPHAQYLFYSMLNINHKAKVAPHVAVFLAADDPHAHGMVAATDGLNLLVNTEKFFDKKFTLANRGFVVGHEVWHVARGDVELLKWCHKHKKVPMRDGTFLPFVEPLLQKAMDICVNALNVESGIGKCPDFVIEHGYCDPKYNSLSSVHDVYRDLYKDDPQGKKAGAGQKAGAAIGGLLQQGVSVGKKPDDPQAQRNQQAWAVAIQIAHDKSTGKLPLGIQRLFDSILDPEVPWTDKIQTLVHRTIGSESLNWNTPSRHIVVEDLYYPSRSGFCCEWIVIGADVSGSMTQKGFTKSLSETSSIWQECKPRRLTMIWIDAAIQRIDEVTDLRDLDDIKKKGAPGGGGTQFKDAFNWVYKQPCDPPDMMVFFTDGHAAPFPKQPAFPVIWACTTDVKIPWGDVVRIKRGLV